MSIIKGFTSSLNSQIWIATQGQTVFTITNGSYTTGKNQIEVFVLGIRQDSGDNYTETSSTSFTLSEGVPNGTKVEAKWFENAVSGLSIGHSASHKAGGQDALDIMQLQNYDIAVGNPIANLSSSITSLNTYVQDPNNRPLRGIGLYFNNYDNTTLNKLIGLLKTYNDMGFNSIVFYADFKLNADLSLDTTFINNIIFYYNQLVPNLAQYNFKHVMLRAGRQNGSKDATANPTAYFNNIQSGLQQLIQGITYTFDSISIANEEPLQTGNALYTTNWQNLIAYIKTIFSGQITISAMMSELYNITFLSNLDIIGCNNYPTITYNPDISQPTHEELRQNFWISGDFTNLLNLAQTYGKKIYVIESGCTTTQYSHFDPGWSGLTGPKDGKSQNRYWRTALPMLDNMYFLAGYFMFEGISSGYSPIASTSDPTLKTFIQDYFNLGVINNG